MGIEKLKAFVQSIAEVLNVLSKVAHGAGVFALVGLVKPAQALMQADFAAIKKELADLSAEERLEVEAAFKSALALVNKEVQAKIESMVNALDECVELVEGQVELVKKAILEVAKIRVILGL